MAKFKVGDKVKVRTWESMVDEFGTDEDGDIHCKCCFVTDMKRYCGKVFTIESVTDSNDYHLEAAGAWKFSDDMLEDNVDCQKIVITTDGKVTTARMYNDKTIVRTATAKCSPEDRFDFERGALIAFARLTNCVGYKLADKEESKFTKKDLKTGMFVHNNHHGWGIIANDNIVYEQGDYDDVGNLSNDLRFVYSQIDIVVKALSFDDAKQIAKRNYDRDICYRRSGI